MKLTRERIQDDGSINGFASPGGRALVCCKWRVVFRDQRADFLRCRGGQKEREKCSL